MNRWGASVFLMVMERWGSGHQCVYGGVRRVEIRHPCKAKWITMASARNERTAPANEARPASPSGLTCVPGSQPRAPPAAGTSTPVKAYLTTCVPVRATHWKHQAGKKAPTTGAQSMRARMTRGTMTVRRTRLPVNCELRRRAASQLRMTTTVRRTKLTFTWLVWPTLTRLTCNVIPALKGTSPKKSAR